MNNNAKITFDYLEKLFPDAKCELNFSTPFEALIAIILSAQCTDKMVNKVTEKLFKVCNTPQQFATIKQEELEKLIYSTGFYHNKAKNIIKMSNQLIDDYNGEIPHNARELEKLAGVGRKVANVFASLIYGANELGVDTHVFRVLNRIGLVKANTPIKTEFEFRRKYPQYVNHDIHFRMVLFGRYHCTAKKPQCENCKLNSFCKYYKNKVK